MRAARDRRPGKACTALGTTRNKASWTTDRDAFDAQRDHWQATFEANPKMCGTDPSQPGAYSAELFTQHHIREVLELGAGQGRDTLAVLRAGLKVTALDYAPEGA